MDAFCLVAVVADVRRRLLDGLVRGAWAAGPEGLWIELLTPAGPEGLLAMAALPLPRLSLGAPRPPKVKPLPPLAAVAQRVLQGARLSAVAHQGLDRVVTLQFVPGLAGTSDTGSSPGGIWLVAELFGRSPNLLLVEPSGRRILEVAHRGPSGAARPLVPGAEYGPPPPATRPDPLVEGPETVAGILAPLLAAGVSPALALRQGLSGVSDLWAREAAAQARDGSAAALAEALRTVLHRIEGGSSQPHLLADEAGLPAAALPIPLDHIGKTRQRLVGSLGEALEQVAAHQTAQFAVASERTGLRRILARLESRLRSRRAHLVNDSMEYTQADVRQRMGEILIANQGNVSRGATEITLPDPTQGGTGDPDATVTIALEPRLTAAANAERYFKRARRARRGSVRVDQRLAQTERELARVQGWAETVGAAEGPQALEAVIAEIRQIPRLLAPQDRKELGALGAAPSAEPSRRAPAAHPPGPPGKRTARAAPPGLEPRQFLSSDAFPILVGRSTEGNDYLTVHLARSQDWWLHVQGRSGSHVVIRVPDRSGNVPRRTLIEAAQLAAYYSQARDDGKVAVDYTLRKYVHKPRKAKPGLVTISQEKTVVVKPDKSLVAKLAQPEAAES
jgi:predicted ribosome quality control (RQC) complex YloA/Tae2 family protein